MAQSLGGNRQTLRAYFVLWTGQAISLFGSQLVQFALIWWLTRQTGSPTVLATASLVGFLPQALLGPFAGTLVDRWNRRWTMFAADGLTALATLVLAYLFLVGWVQLGHVYLILFIRALATSFHWPAMAASTSLMVPEKQLARVQGLNQTVHGALNIVSAPAGALLLGILPVEGVLAIDVATALFAIVPLLFIVVPQPNPGDREPGHAAASAEHSSVWSDLAAGLRYALAWPGLLAITAMAALVNLFLNPAFALLPLFVTDHFKGGALQLGWLESAWGAGVVLGGLLLGVWGGFRRRIVTALLGLVALGAGVTIFGLMPSSAFLPAVGTLFFVGMTNPMINGPFLAIVQSVVAPEMQGRILGLLGSTSAIMTPLGLAFAGPLAELFGVRSWYVAGGLLTAVLGCAALFIPAVMTVEETGRAKAESAPVLGTSPELPADQPTALRA